MTELIVEVTYYKFRNSLIFFSGLPTKLELMAVGALVALGAPSQLATAAIAAIASLAVIAAIDMREPSSAVHADKY